VETTDKANLQPHKVVEQMGSDELRNCSCTLVMLNNFLLKHPDIDQQSRVKLPAYFDDSQKIRHVKLELADVVDYRKPF